MVDNDNSCLGNCSVSVSGSSSATVSNGSGTTNCDSTGYFGTVSYSCSGGVANVTGSCSAVTCTAPSGTGYGAQSSLSYATLGSGSFAKKLQN